MKRVEEIDSRKDGIDCRALNSYCIEYFVFYVIYNVLKFFNLRKRDLTPNAVDIKIDSV